LASGAAGRDGAFVAARGGHEAVVAAELGQGAGSRRVRPSAGVVVCGCFPGRRRVGGLGLGLGLGGGALVVAVGTGAGARGTFDAARFASAGRALADGSGGVAVVRERFVARALFGLGGFARGLGPERRPGQCAARRWC